MTADDLSQALRATLDYQALLKSNPGKARQWEQNLMREAGVQLGREATISSPKPVIPALGPEPVARPDLPSIVPSQETAEGATGFLKRAALPTAGAVVGGMVSPGMGIPLGGMAGEAANQILGITEPSLTQVGLQGIVPMAAKGGAAALQRAPKMLPGASAALQEEGAATARGLPNVIAPPARSSAMLYENLKSYNDVSIDTPHLVKEVNHLRAMEQKIAEGLKSEPLLKVTGGLKEKAGATPAKMEAGKIVDAQGHPILREVAPAKERGLTFGDFKENFERLGKKIGATDEPELKGAYKSLYRSMLDDLESASKLAKGEPAKLFKEARTAYKREFARMDFAEAIEKRGINKAGEYLDQVNPNAIARWIKSDDAKFFREAVTSQEMQSIERTLKQLSQIPTVPVKRGAPIGSGRRIATLGLGAGIGGYAGGGLGAAVGAYAMDKGSDLIARALMSDTGRKALIKIVTANGGRFGQDEAALLSAYVTGGVSPGAELHRQLTQ